MTIKPLPPLVPADVDLRDFDFMPLDVKRLRDSTFARKVRPDEFRAGVLLWCAAWHQIPAGSLPDDNDDLAGLAGYGYAVKEWLRIKAGALYGWVKCDDGRLYHKTMAEKALESWNSKLHHAYGRFCDRIRKENKVRLPLPPLPVPTFAVWNSDGRQTVIPPETKDFPPETTSDPPEKLDESDEPKLSVAGIPPENSLKREVRDKEGKEEEGQKQTRERRKSALPEWLPRKPWDDFVEFRKTIRKPLTDRAMELAIDQLDAMRKGGNEPGAVLNQSIQNTWTSLRPLKDVVGVNGSRLGVAGQRTADNLANWLNQSEEFDERAAS